MLVLGREGPAATSSVAAAPAVATTALSMATGMVDILATELHTQYSVTLKCYANLERRY